MFVRIIFFALLWLVFASECVVAQDFWQRVETPGGADIRYVAANNTGQQVCMTQHQGYFRSSDNGHSWRHIPEIPTFFFLQMVADSSGNFFANGRDELIHHSTDGGATWLPTGMEALGALAVDAQGVVHIAGNGRLARSNDAGVTWNDIEILSGPILDNPSLLTFAPNGNIFIAGSDSLMISQNGGAHWRLIHTSEFNDNRQQIFDIAVSPDGVWFVQTIFWDLYRTTNEGESWQKLTDQGALQQVVRMTMSKNGQLIVTNRVTDGLTLKTADNGETWQDITALMPVAAPDIHEFENGGNDCMYVTVRGGLYRSTDTGETWSWSSRGLGYAEIHGFEIADDGMLIASTQNGIFRTSDLSSGWRHVGAETQYLRLLGRNNRGHLFAGDHKGRLFRSGDNGLQWTPESLENDKDNPFTTILEHTDGFIAVGDTEGWVHISTDDGKSWASSDLQTGAVADLQRGVNGDLYAGAQMLVVLDGIDFRVIKEGGALRSGDNGETWQLLNNGEFPVRRVALDQDDNVYLGIAGAVVTTQDNGATWDSDRPGDSPFTGVLEFLFNDSLYFGGNDEAFVSTDRGANWRDISSGLAESTSFRVLDADRHNFLYAATSTGLYRSSNAVKPVANEPAESEIRLSIYPQPAAAQARVSYFLSEPEYIRLYIVDNVGKVVAVVHDGLQASGDQAHAINTVALASGYYQCRLQLQNRNVSTGFLVIH